jgi:hypothetical protein
VVLVASRGSSCGPSVSAVSIVNEVFGGPVDKDTTYTDLFF